MKRGEHKRKKGVGKRKGQEERNEEGRGKT